MFYHSLLTSLALVVPSLGYADYSLPPPWDWEIGQTVRTSSGYVEGHASSWKNQVSEYLGIPYAKPPVKGLRFEAPVKYNGVRKVMVADKYVRLENIINRIHSNALSIARKLAWRVSANSQN